MIKNKQIIDYVRDLAPEYLAHSWDNVGTLIGDEAKETDRVLIGLELTEEVLEEGLKLGAGLIITHHPVIFKPVDRINSDTPLGRKIMKAIKNDITVYCTHTNMDETNGGTNDVLFDLLNLKNKTFLCPSQHEGFGMGRIGEIEKPLKLKAFVLYVKNQLGLNSIVFSGDENITVKKVGLCTGAASGKSYFLHALQGGCDVYITGDVKHHEALDALEEGLAIIDATHFATENILSAVLKEYIEKRLREDKIENIEIYESKTIKGPLKSL